MAGMARMITFISMLALMGAIASPARADDRLSPPLGKELKVYHIGNSLTRNVPVERLKLLFESVQGNYDYGTQLGGGHKLDQHLSKRNHDNAPGTGSYNTIAPYGEYDNAFKNYKWDAVVLQPYMEELDKEPVITEKWPYYTAGSFQSASEFIDYARGKTRPGDQGWHRQNPNTTHESCKRFYIYATWPSVAEILKQEGEKTYAAYYAQKYSGGSRPCADYFAQLADNLNQKHTDLEVPVRVIPAGEVMARLDVLIREGKLPGIVEFHERNQAYYKKARRNNNSPSPYDPETFDPSQGVLNFYADNIHMNDQPHNGADSGTIGSYVAALTIFATLTGQSPVGLTAAPYEMFDAEKDAALIKALQETVWDVVVEYTRSGVAIDSANGRSILFWGVITAAMDARNQL